MNKSLSLRYTHFKISIPRALIVCIGAIGVSACGGPQRNVRFTDHKKADNVVTSFSTPSDLRLAFLRDNNTGAMYCAEPMPDVALSSEASGSGSLAASLSLSQAAVANATLSQENEALRNELRKVKDRDERSTEAKELSSASRSVSSSIDNSGSGSLNLAATARLAVTVAELGGRTQQVLLAREFLYRICEARANNFFEGADAYVTLQNNALRLIESIASSQRQSSDAERNASSAELVKQVIAYNAQQYKNCDERSTACESVAAKDEAKKTECAKAKQQCVDAIKPLVPALGGPTTPKDSNLPIPTTTPSSGGASGSASGISNPSTQKPIEPDKPKPVTPPGG